ncbi:hypothetical protein RA276_31545, partial [Pseudomonas syringae pv. tagetis]
VVAGVGANVVNVIALGQLPDSMTRDRIHYVVAGLNPIMNAPSHGRAQQNQPSIDEDQKDNRIQNSTQPRNKRQVMVKAG